MTTSDFKNEKSYLISLNFAKSLLDAKVINTDEFNTIKRKLLEKYKPIKSSFIDLTIKDKY